MAPRLFHPLIHKNFRALSASELVSSIGDWLVFVALLSVVAYKWDLGASGLAEISIAQSAPFLIAGPFAGTIADRYNRKQSLVYACLVRAACSVGLVFAPSMLWLTVFVAVRSAGGSIYTTVEATVVRDTVPESELMGANALTSLINQGMKIVGPALGGLLFAVSGASVCFAIDAGTFLIAAALLSGVRLPARQSEDGPDRSVWTISEMTAGIGAVWKISVLRIAVISLSLTVLLAFVFDTLTPLLVESLGLSSRMLGVSVGAVGLGSAAGAVVIAQWAQHLRPLRLMSVAQATAGALVAVAGALGLLALSAAPVAVLLVVVMIGVGFGASGIFIGYPTILQTASPPEKLGRVMAVAQVLPTALQLLAPVIAAGLAAVISPEWVFITCGGALALIGVGFLISPAASWSTNDKETGFPTDNMDRARAAHEEACAEDPVVPPIDVERHPG